MSNLILGPNKTKESNFIIPDVIAGDEQAYKRLEDLDFNIEELHSAMQMIFENDSLSESKKRYLLTNSWRVLYKEQPPSMNEFLTDAWLGPTADSLYPHVVDILTNFWQPDSKYRNLILASAIGTGKALPDSSPVVVDKVYCIEFELEDGTILTFDENEYVWVYYPNLKLMKAKNILLEEVKDFPVLLNYLYMKLYNVEKIKEFQEAFDIDSYDELILFFRHFNTDFYKERGIVVQNHHILPRSEGGSDKKSNLILLPFFFHIKSHYLRAKEHELNGDRRNALKNYKAVRYSLGMTHLPKTEVEILKRLQFVVESLEKRNQLESIQFFVKKEGEKSKKIFKEEWPEYEKNGWEKGRTFKNPTGKRWVNKNGESYYVLEEEFEEYLSKGYSAGMFLTEKMKEANPKRASYSTLNTIWMHKEDQRKCVPKEEVDIYKENGWKMGSNSKTSSGKTWKWKEEHLGRNLFTNGEKRIWAKECPEGYWPEKFHLKGKHWYHNGEIMVAADTCPEGFVFGRLKTNKVCYTNGVTNIYSETCPEGYWKGKTQNANKKNQ